MKVLENHWKTILNKEHTINISPLELQIAYKLYLASDKDISDAVFLYTLFKKALNREELNKWAEKLGVNTSILESRG